MTIKKFGSPEKIKLCKSSDFAFDPNIIVKKIVQSQGTSPMTIDQVHEAVKALGIVDYSADDLEELLTLLESSGVIVKKS